MSEALSDKPLISIVTATYNNGPLLSRFFDSILAQTYPHWELIVVNDGSTDNTQDVCNAYAERDARIRIFSQENQGQSVARNLALNYIQGELVSFVDTDDALCPQTYESALAVLQQHCECDIVGFPIEEIRPNERFILGCPEKPILGREAILDSLFTDQKVRLFVTDKLHKAHLIKGITFAPGVLMEDNLFMCQIALRAKGICFSQVMGYEYYQAEYDPNKNDWTDYKEYSQIYINVKMVEALNGAYPELPTQRIRTNLRVCNQVVSCIRYQGWQHSTVQMGKPSLAGIYWRDIYRSRISLKYKLKLSLVKLWAMLF